MPFSDTALSWLTLIALVLAVVATALGCIGIAASRRVATRRPRPRKRGPGGEPEQLTSAEVSTELAALNSVVATSLRHLAVVRYDAFGDMGGHLSWSMALLDDLGDGVVLTSIHGRSESRTYAKNVSAWTASQQLSPEEEEAITFARYAQSS
jgi:hypothetical protein